MLKQDIIVYVATSWSQNLNNKSPSALCLQFYNEIQAQDYHASWVVYVSFKTMWKLQTKQL